MIDRLPGVAGVVWRPSPNFDARKRPVRQILLHYTGMPDGADAVARLTDPAARVSAHYHISEAGEIVQMVALDRRAWHAGVSSWRGEGDINSSSVGIELQNPGHEWGYRPFPAAQMAAVVALVRALKAYFAVDRADVIGHADVAPVRKEDPGELFDWPLLAREGLALARPGALLPDPGWGEADFSAALSAFGYDVSDLRAATVAFQRRFRQQRPDGGIDAETRAILATLMQA